MKLHTNLFRNFAATQTRIHEEPSRYPVSRRLLCKWNGGCLAHCQS